METVKTTPWRSYGTLDLLDRTFRIYRDHFTTFIVLVAVVSVPLTIIDRVISLYYVNHAATFTPGATTNTAANLSSINNALNLLTLYLGVLFITSILRVTLIDGPLVYITSEANTGRRPTIGETFKAIRGRLPYLAGGTVLFYIIGGGAFFAFAFASVLCFVCGLGIGFLVYVLVPLYAFLSPILILENISMDKAIGRAWALGKTRFWSVLLITVVLSAISIVLNLGISVLLTLATGQSFGIYTGSAQVIQIISTVIITILLAPILPIGFTLLYYDTRIRVEGIDLIVAALEKPDMRPGDVYTPRLASKMTSQDYTNVAILTVGIIAIGVFFVGLIYALAPSVFFNR